MVRRESGHWEKFGLKLANWMDGTHKAEPFSVFGMVGNVKLPFVTFSTLPEYTCPGAGECLEWCYSFKSWRYPAAFFRQIQNTIMVQHHKARLAKLFCALPEGRTVRLYVDGDIDNLKTLEFWMDTIGARPDLAVYGYSKSWKQFLEYRGTWPSNYVLNISAGSTYGNDVKNRMMELPIVRGTFDVVPVPRELAGKYDQPEYQKAVRSQAKGFVCPGRCGTCTKSTHACGDHRFDGVPVLIGIH